MAVKLTPRIYSQKLTWDALPKNTIDTVTMKPVIRDFVETDVNVQEITSGLINKRNYSFPLADKDTVNTHHQYGYNFDDSFFYHKYVADYAVEVTMVEGSYDIDLEEPISGIPTVSFNLEGTVSYLERGVNTVDEIRTGHVDGSMYEFIEQNAISTESIEDNKIYDRTNRSGLNSGLILDLNQGWIPTYAWVIRTTGSVPSNIVPFGTKDYWETYDYLNSQYRPKDYEILTNWAPASSTSEVIPIYNLWKQSGTDITRQGPYDWPLWSDYSQYYNRFIPINEGSVSVACSVTKISDYKLRVRYSLPVRYGYLAAARTLTETWGWDASKDSYGYMFKVSKITITTKALQTSDDEIELSYSRVSDEELTTNVLNNNVLSIDKNPFITTNTYCEDDKTKLWTSYMSQFILNRYKEGKYIVECTVPIWWAIEHEIGINRQLKIKLQDGTFISRGSDICIFQVKTIEKIFKNSSFVYSIRLLEMYKEIEYEQLVAIQDELFIEADGKNFMVIKEEEDE